MGFYKICNNYYNIKFYVIAVIDCKIKRLVNVCNGEVKVLSYAITLLELKSLIYIYIYKLESRRRLRDMMWN